jgi:aspartyl-tRNA(Asn)/glutamyl-tRNA(Gln) amidotransferase subunit A
MIRHSWQALDKIAASVRRGSVRAIDLTTEALSLIEASSEYNTVILTLKDRALELAEEVDRKVRRGQDPGPLAGVPYIAKDNFLVYGGEARAGSKILNGFVPPYQATAINRLEAAGAICVAKANMDAFAHGASTENSDFGVVKNPYDKTRVPGGSSGGSAAAVALGLVPFALGTDTGGSIRQPSSFCGVFGLKPTYGLISRSGVIAMGSSLDCIGPIANSVADAALVVEVLAGKDPLDATTVDRSKERYVTKPLSLSGLKIGVVKEYVSDGVAADIKQAFDQTVADLEKAGADVCEVSLPSTKLALACYYIICPAEVSSNLSRYDGIRYGYHDASSKNLDDSYLKTRGRGFGKEAKRRIMIGTFVLSSGYYDAYYKKAMTVRTMLIKEFESAFKKIDFLIGPVAPTVAFKIGEKTKNPLDMYLADVLTVPANLAGIPAASVPIGFNEQGLPIGLQLMSAMHSDRNLLGLAMSIEGLS